MPGIVKIRCIVYLILSLPYHLLSKESPYTHFTNEKLRNLDDKKSVQSLTAQERWSLDLYPGRLPSEPSFNPDINTVPDLGPGILP